MTLTRVLLVDDNQAMRKTLSEWLSRIPGVSVVAQAASGSEAIAELERTRPDVVLTDVEMPGMSGFELALRIKQMAGAPRVVLMTACDDLPCYEKLSQLVGANAYMHKNRIYDLLSRYLTTQFGTGARPTAFRDVHAGGAREGLPARAGTGTGTSGYAGWNRQNAALSNKKVARVLTKVSTEN